MLKRAAVIDSFQHGLELKENKKEYWIIPKGTFRHEWYGKLDFNDAFFEEVLNNFDNQVLGETEPFIDQDHDQRGAAGWIKGLRIAKEGLYAVIEWTEAGEELIEKKIYRYFSPTLSSYTDPQNEKTYNNVLRGGALTNIPFLKMLPEITLTEPGLVEIALSEIKTSKESNTMNILDDLKKMFKIEEDDETKAFAAVVVKIEDLTKLAEKASEVEALTAKVTELEAKVAEKKETEMKEKPEIEQKLVEVLDDNKKLNEKISLMERDVCIKKALTEGRMLPDQRKFYEDLWKESPALSEKAIDALKKVVNVDGKGSSNVPTEQEVVELSENEVEVHQAFGHSEEDIKKFGGLEAE